MQRTRVLVRGIFVFLGSGLASLCPGQPGGLLAGLLPGPRRGLAIVGRRQACVMIAGLSAGFGFPLIVQLAEPGAPVVDLAFRLLGILVIAVAVAVTRVRGPVAGGSRGW